MLGLRTKRNAATSCLITGTARPLGAHQAHGSWKVGMDNGLSTPIFSQNPRITVLVCWTGNQLMLEIDVKDGGRKGIGRASLPAIFNRYLTDQVNPELLLTVGQAK